MSAKTALPRVFIGCVVSLLIFLYGVMVFMTIVTDYRLTVDGAKNQASAMARALNEHAVRTLGEAENMLITVTGQVSRAHWTAATKEQTLHDFLAGMKASSPQIKAVVVVGADGRVLATSDRLPKHSAVTADRDYFRHHSRHDDGNSYLGTGFSSGIDNRWVFTISRRISNRDGSLRMIVCVEIAAAYFDNFYNSLNLSDKKSDRFFLLRNDGSILFAYPFSVEIMSRNFKESEAIRDHLPHTPNQTYETSRPILGGAPRIVSYQASRVYPVLSLISLSREDLLAPWKQRAMEHSGGALLSVLLIFGLTWTLIARLKQITLTNQTLVTHQTALAASEGRYSQLVNSLDAIVWEYNLETECFTYVNLQACKITGYPVERWLNEPGFWASKIYDDDRAEAVAYCMDAIRKGEDHEFQYRFVTSDGSLIWLRDLVTVNRDQSGTLALRGIMLDVTDRVYARQELELAAHVFEDSQQSIIITDRDGTILRVNRYFTTLSGFSPEEVIGLTPRVLKSNRHEPDFYAKLWKQLLEEGWWKGEIWNRKKNGDGFAALLSISSVRDKSGVIQYFIGMIEDITEQKTASERIFMLAHYDILTQLPNRQLFSDRFTHALGHAERLRAKLALMMLDIDNFKRVNDTLGHHAGDQLLREIANRLLGNLRKIDTVARLGGDEFAILLEDISDPSDVERIAHKIIESISAPVNVEGTIVYVGVSIGVSMYPADGATITSLFKNADTAMYRAKAQGKMRCQFFDTEMATQVARRLALETDLRLGIPGQLFLEYQPQIELATGCIIAVEVLVRWQHPVMGLIGPADFIPIAEETGLITTLGAWVLEQACRQAAYWHFDAGMSLRIAVNVSALQLVSPSFGHLVQDVLKKSGLPPQLLEIELTESAAMSNVQNSILVFNRLKLLGISIAIDDFGTGYSSLSHLKKLPIDRLKVDRSFIMDTPDDKEDVAIVRTIIAMAQSLNLEVIAEGVESEQQLQFLKNEQCDVIQGFLISRPVLPEKLEPLWRAQPAVVPDQPAQRRA